MKPIDFSEIKNIADYELERKSWRPAVMALKSRRRIRVGEHVTFLFENRETVRYQIQEMMRVERLVEPEAIRHELETYNELIPGPGELSASLLIEYESPEERKIRLRELLGLEDHVWLVVDGAEPVGAQFDRRQIASDRISSVQYIKFKLSPEQAACWMGGVRLVVDHPNYQAEQELTPEQLRELAQDLA